MTGNISGQCRHGLQQATCGFCTNPRDVPVVAYRKYRTCDRKKAYPNMESGWNAVRSIQRNGNDPYPDFELRPYVCAFCHQVHVGHSNTPRSSEARLQAATEAFGIGLNAAAI